MRRLTVCAGALCLSAFALRVPLSAEQSQSVALQPIDLAERLTVGKLRGVNREVTALEGSRGVHVTEKAGPGVVWIEGSNFAEGIIEVDVRSRDVLQESLVGVAFHPLAYLRRVVSRQVLRQSFVGVAFHRKDDRTYDAVYVRPLNFRTNDPARRQNAVQCMAVPEYDWPRLRKEFPGEFENPVDPSVAPTEWVPLRVVVKDRTVQVYVGAVKSPTLEVRKLGSHDRGLIGLWVGNTSDGDFASLRLTPTK